MMSNFVRHHVRLRELAVRPAKARFQFVEKAQIEIDFFICRAIERSGRVLRHPAAGRIRIAK